MLKELLNNIWEVRKEFFGILAMIIIALIFTSYASVKGKEKSIEEKMQKWEVENYHLTEYRKGIIMKACLDDFDDADNIINSLGSQQPNFDR